MEPIEIEQPATKKSWKTTWAGIVGAIGACLAFIVPWLNNSHDPRLQAIGGLLMAFGIGGVGLAGRDNKRSDQDVGVRVEPTPRVTGYDPVSRSK